MRYTLKRDDMPLLSQWIKKEVTFGRQKLLLFCERAMKRIQNPEKFVWQNGFTFLQKMGSYLTITINPYVYIRVCKTDATLYH